MSNQMRGSGAGVVVLSCSDPRLNPYQILGLDQTLSIDALDSSPHDELELMNGVVQKRP